MLGLPITNTIPPPYVVRATIGGLLRELQIARGMLRLAKLAAEQRSLTPDTILVPNQPTATTPSDHHDAR